MSEPFWTPLGGQPVDYEGLWNAGTQYAPGDVVVYNGVNYLAVNPSLGSPPPPALGLAMPYVFDRVVTPLEITSSAAEASIYTKALTAGLLGTDRMLRLTVIGDFLCNATNSIRLRAKLGGVTFLDHSNAAAGAAVATRRTWRWETYVSMLGAQNSEYLQSAVYSGNSQTGSGGTTTAGDSPLGGNVLQTGNNPGEHGGSAGLLGSVDMSAPQTLDLTVQWDNALATLAWRRRYAVMEIV